MPNASFDAEFALPELSSAVNRFGSTGFIFPIMDLVAQSGARSEDLEIPAPELSATGQVIIDLTADLIFPAPSLSARAYTGVVGSLSGSVPVMELLGGAHLSISASADMQFPMPFFVPGYDTDSSGGSATVLSRFDGYLLHYRRWSTDE